MGLELREKVTTRIFGSHLGYLEVREELVETFKEKWRRGSRLSQGAGERSRADRESIHHGQEDPSSSEKC